MREYSLMLPLSQSTIDNLRAGDSLLLSGKMLVMRDAAHKRIDTALRSGNCDIDFHNQTIYYMGPCPPKPSEIIGSCGPTTAARMDSFTPLLHECGLKITIGKGGRSQEVIDSIVANRALYLIAIGGAGALYKSCVTDVKLLAYADLGAEALLELTVIDFPAIVAVDSLGNNIINC